MTDSPDTDWSAVCEQLIRGERLAFLQMNRLITGFLVQLRAYDFEQEWDDLRQEVVLAVVQNARAGRLREAKAFVGYVRIITRNKFADRLKGRIRRHEKDSLPWGDEILADESPQPSPELWSAVEALPTDQRRVIEGVYLEGKTYDEVSSDTGIPLGTMKRRLREGLEALRKFFSGAAPHG